LERPHSDFFRRSIKAAQAEGTVRADIVARDFARLLLGVLRGRDQRALDRDRIEGKRRGAVGAGAGHVQAPAGTRT
jgi:hypothetical protein